MAPPGRGTGGPAIRLVLVIAVLLGLAGAILLAPAPSSAGTQLLPSFTVPAAPTWIGPALVLGFAGILVAYWIAQLLRGENTPTMRRFALVGLVGLGLLLAFTELFRSIHGGTALTHRVNTTGNATAPPNATCLTTSSCGGAAPGGPVPVPPVEGALVYVLLVVVAVVLVVLFPRIEGAWLAWRAPRAASPVPSDRIGPLTDALARLRDPAAVPDARARIIRAYGELLRRVASAHERLEPSTPREIAQDLERDFGVRRATAEEMTALFEDARYSRGVPLDEAAVARAERALERAIAESAERARKGR